VAADLTARGLGKSQSLTAAFASCVCHIIPAALAARNCFGCDNGEREISEYASTEGICSCSKEETESASPLAPCGEKDTENPAAGRDQKRGLAVLERRRA
jgi:hypothetical protein